MNKAPAPMSAARAGHLATCLSLIALLSSAATASAAELAKHTFGTSTATYVPTTVAPNVTAGNCTLGAGLSGGYALSTGTGNPPSSLYVRSSVTTEAVSAASTDHIKVTVRANTGYVLNLSSLSFDYSRYQWNSGEAGTWTVRSSLDGYAANLGVVSASGGAYQTSTPWVNTGSISLSGAAFQNIPSSTTVEFRIYLTDNSTQAGSQLRTDNITINGAVVPSGTTPLTKILFMGNSFTHGGSNVFNYNSANIHDFNGTNHGGVPGVFLKMATTSGVTNLQVSVELVGGYTLSDHRANKIAALTSPGQWGPYSWVILQDYSGRATPFTAINGNVTQFRTDVNEMNTLAKAASPGVKTLLYTTWGVPSYVPTYFSSIQTMQNTVTTNYRAAAVDFSLGGGQTPVGQAFMLAVSQGLSINPNITTTPGAGQLNLWDADKKHASKYGSYLAALMFYQKILGLDPRAVPKGTGSVRENLGISLDHATRLADVAYAARSF